jgi:AraC family transcriptional regulator
LNETAVLTTMGGPHGHRREGLKTFPMHAPVETSNKAPRRAVAGVGRVLLWSGGSLWIGRQAGRVERHAHHAVQVTLALDIPFRLRGDTAGATDATDAAGAADAVEWREYRGAIVMPNQPHAFDGRGGAALHLFVAPETTQGRLLLERHGAAPITDLPGPIADVLVSALRQAHAQHEPDEALVALARQAIAALAGPVPPVHGVDPRIDRAIGWVRQRLDASVSLTDAAAVAHLSPSRFRHLFVAQTGISFRAYLLWARVETAVGAAMGGQSWTAAAQHAGFADSAHLSRTCRRMFGIAPVTLVRE